MSGFSTGSGQAPDAALERFRRQIIARAPQALAASGAVLKTEIVRQLSTPGQGRYYAKASRVAGEMPAGRANTAARQSYAKRRARVRRLNMRRRAFATALNAGAIAFEDITSRQVLTGLHRASAPGAPPAPDSGTLRRSAFIEQTETGVRVGVAMPYAQALEFGTTRAGRDRNVTILPRPFMRPALAKVRAQLGPIFRTSIAAALRTGGR